MQIALDGGAGVGKSTVAKRLAQRLEILYVNTGAMYRAIAWGVDAGLSLDQMVIDLEGESVFVNGHDVTAELYNERMDDLSSQLSAKPEVRQKLIGLQQRIAAQKSVVMEGRDIGTVVLPNATLKIYLTASAQERARRRAEQRGEDYQSVLDMIIERDGRDREGHGRQPAPDAVRLDSTSKSIDEVVDCVIARLRETEGAKSL